jgi:hypothetical protein
MLCRKSTAPCAPRDPAIVNVASWVLSTIRSLSASHENNHHAIRVASHATGASVAWNELRSLPFTGIARDYATQEFILRGSKDFS